MSELTQTPDSPLSPIEVPIVENIVQRLPKSNIDNIRRQLGIAVKEESTTSVSQDTKAKPIINEVGSIEDPYGSTVIKELFLPMNSETLTYKEHTSRFSGAEWFNKICEMEVCLAGLGGIGSYVAFLLSRLNVHSLTVFDDDRVDASNLSGQLFCVRDIESYKTAAIYNLCSTYSNYYNLSTRCRKFDTGDSPCDIMICGFDNMAARKIYFNVWKEYVERLPDERKAECLFIDGRLAAEDFQVFCIVGNHPIHIQRYEEKYLFSDAEADRTVCSYKQTSFCANMVASVMINLFVNFAANLCHPIINRSLPFYTEYDGQFMTFNTSY